MKNIVMICFLLWLIIPDVHSQELGEFEDSFREAEGDQEEESEEATEESGDEETESEFSRLLLEFIGRLIWYAFISGGSYSNARMDSSNEDFLHPRQVGEPLIPILRSDTAFHYLSTDLFALDERVEVGYGAFGVAGRYTLYFETDRYALLHLWEVHLLYRMSIAHMIEFSPGLGAFGMEGESRYGGFSLTCPLRLYFKEAFSLEVVSTLNFYSSGAVGSDLDMGLLLDLSWIRPRLGYRRYSSSGGAALHAAYLGATLIY